MYGHQTFPQLRTVSRLEGIMLQIFIIILFRISSKLYHYAHYYAQNLPIIIIILNFTGEFLQLFSLCN